MDIGTRITHGIGTGVLGGLAGAALDGAAGAIGAAFLDGAGYDGYDARRAAIYGALGGAVLNGGRCLFLGLTRHGGVTPKDSWANAAGGAIGLSVVAGLAGRGIVEAAGDVTLLDVDQIMAASAVGGTMLLVGLELVHRMVFGRFRDPLTRAGWRLRTL